MKKIFLLFAAMLCHSIFAEASAIQTDTVKKDTAKINRKIRDLQADLADYKSQLTKVQNQIPIDSVALIKATAKADDALADSKKAANNAVGGDLGDAKKAEKKAKEAANAKDDAHDAQKQFEDDQKQIKKLNKKIDKTQKKINELQSQQ
jgi:chromosome segregation ATPase